MFDVKTVDETIKIIEENFKDYALEMETVQLEEALGRITASDITASEYIPGFNRSTVDGYAVISSDTFGASEAIPAQLKLIQEVQMGKSPQVPVKAGQAAYVPTGGELPPGADAMVMVEYTDDFEDGYIYINKSAAPGSHIIYRGDDVSPDKVVIRAATVLKPHHIGALAAMGYTEVQVKRKPLIGILSTGDELVGIEEKAEGATVRDVNSYLVNAAASECSFDTRMYGIVRDHYDSIYETVEKALKECDAVVISGGSSVGTRDETVKVISALGNPGVLVHGIAVKPGKPTILGNVKGKAVIGLPGHPVSAYFIFKLVGFRLLSVLNGVAPQQEKIVLGNMTCNYPSNNGREEYLPVRLEGENGCWKAYPVFGKSGLITLLASADGYVHIPRGSEGLGAGARVEVVLF